MTDRYQICANCGHYYFLHQDSFKGECTACDTPEILIDKKCPGFKSNSAMKVTKDKTNTNIDIDDCLYHRCSAHRSVLQINDYEHSGAECGACIKDYYEAILAMTVARLGGKVEDHPTSRINFLQRIDELRRIERNG